MSGTGHVVLSASLLERIRPLCNVKKEAVYGYDHLMIIEVELPDQPTGVYDAVLDDNGLRFNRDADT